MIERIEGLPAGGAGGRGNGKLTREDYDAVVVPLLAEVQREQRRLRCLIEVDGFDGITPDAAFEDIKLGLRAMGSFDGCAVVSDLPSVGQALRLPGFLMPYPLRIFPVGRRDEATAWLAGLPAGPAITHRVLADAGVVVVEVAEPLRAQDVEALATVVDGWLAEHPTLHGLVVHARAFPAGRTSAGSCATCVSSSATTATW